MNQEQSFEKDIKINDHSIKMELVRFNECKFDIEARYCEKCRQIVNNEIFPCPKCKKKYSKLPPIWHFYFVIVSEQINKNEKLDVEAIGSIMDNVMGFSIKEFIYIINQIGDDIWFEWIHQFFLHFSFAIYRSYDRIHKINLPPGVEITFKSWIIPRLKVINIDPERIDSILLEKYLNDSDDDDDDFYHNSDDYDFENYNE
ncbi:hypothetical protein M9Y10_019213 [Tritrichomonas musculus]|uniref:Uncharacterized protein n=1 Tax=Tritrichomonas musculus TaxID=1915356 RepID=A0ABR2HIU5_9EUKA